jgi:hypothetical protein
MDCLIYRVQNERTIDSKENPNAVEGRDEAGERADSPLLGDDDAIPPFMRRELSVEQPAMTPCSQ